MKTLRYTSFLVLLLIAGLVKADVEPNNSIAEAETVSLGTVTGDLTSGSDVDDYYVLNVPTNGLLEAELTTDPGLSARLIVYNSSGASLEFSAFANGTTVLAVEDCIAAGPIYIRVDQNGGSGNYSIDLDFVLPALSNDMEPNNAFGDAQSLAYEGTTEGHLGYVNGSASPVDQDDYYATIPVEEGRINVQLITTNSLSARIMIYNNNGSLLTFSGFATNDTVMLSRDCLAPDTVFIRVDWSGGCGGYQLSYTWDAPDYANDVEPNNSLAQAQSLMGFVETTGRLGYVNAPNIPTDQDDYYGTWIPTNGTFQGRLITTNTLSARMILYNRDGTTLSFSPFATNDTSNLSFSCLREDSAFLRVDLSGGCGAYRLQYTIDSPDVARDVEPNNSFDDAIFLGQGLGSGRTGHIGFVNGFSDQDDYYFGVPTLDGRIRIRIINDGAQSSRVLLYNDNRSLLASSAFVSDTVFLEYDCVAGGDTIYFNVDNSSGCGGYRLSYGVVPNSTPNDVEPNNSIAEAFGFAFGAPQSGHLGYANGSDNPTDIHDYYATVLPADGRVTFTTISENSLNSRIALYSKGGSLLTTTAFATADTVVLSYDCLAADTVYVQIQRGGGCGGYRLFSSLETPVQANDAEPNNSFAEAASLTSNLVQEGHLGYSNFPVPIDADDYYAYNPQDTGLLHVQVISTNTLNARLATYTSSGSAIAFTSFVTADTINYFYNAPSGDTLYFRIQRGGGCGGYTIEVDNGCAQPTGITEDLIISIGAQLEWDDMPDAVGGYNIMGRRQGGANFQVGLGIPNSRYRAFPLQSCETYEYKVESVCATRTSGYTPLRPFTTLCSPFCPALTGVTADMITSSSARVRWANSIVNTGTQVQYTPVGGSTQTVNAPGGQNFVNLSGLMAGTTYNYTVQQACYDGGISPLVSGSFATATLREDGSFSALLFPNPAMDQLSIQGLDVATPAVVLNAQGQVVLQVQLQAGTSSIDVSGLAPGQYALRLTGENQNNTMRFAIVR